jgi:hypothetical protein
MAGDEVVLPFIEEDGFFGLTLLLRMGASGLKETSSLRREDSGFFPCEHLFPSTGGIEFWNGLEQELSVGMEGTSEKIFRLGHLNNLSHIHHSDSITNMFYNSKIMGNEKISKTQLIS